MFKKGDRVKCLHNYYDSLGQQFTAGKIYIVRVDGNHCSVVADDSGEENGWGGIHFELVKNETNKVSNLQVGDRVSVYGFAKGDNTLLEGAWATICEVINDGIFLVEFDADGVGSELFRVHPKQCRRLVKKNAKTS